MEKQETEIKRKLEMETGNGNRCYREFDRSEILSLRHFLGNFIAERNFLLGNIIADRKYDRSQIQKLHCHYIKYKQRYITSML